MDHILIASTIVATALLYSVGLERLWRASGRGRGISTRQALAFDAGLIVLAAALLSPLHHWGEELFAAHMVQHELLMIVAAPLLVIGRPLVAFAWCLPSGATRRIGGWLRADPVARGWRAVSAPLPAWMIHAAALWVWHLPLLFELTLTSDLAHGLQHTSFFATALLFWWSLIGHTRARGAGILYLFTTALHTGLLGALLTFAPHPWYPAYGATAAAWGLTPVEDQQLGGLIMWMPGSVAYVIAGLVLSVRWMRLTRRLPARAA